MHYTQARIECDVDFDEYQQAALTTAIYPNQGGNLVYPALGLAGESGEICEKIGNGLVTDNDRKALAKELGDVLWYVAITANELGVSMSKVALMNCCQQTDISAYQECLSVTGGYLSVVGGPHRSTALSLASSAGAVCDRVKKMFRDDDSKLTRTRRIMILADLGSVLRYVSMLATELGESLGRIAKMNIEKLADREIRGTIAGDGDNR